MAEAVVFTYSSWTTRFPEFASVPEATAQLYFNDAAVLWDNQGYSPARLISTQESLMNLLTAHIAALYWSVPSQGGPGPAQPNGPVGRIASATEGSVSVSTDLGLQPTASAFKAWLQQTKYGLQFLAMIAQYMNMRYIPGRLQPGGLPGERYGQQGGYGLNGYPFGWRRFW